MRFLTFFYFSSLLLSLTYTHIRVRIAEETVMEME